MSDLPKGWTKTTFGEVATIVAGGTPLSKDSSNFTKEGGTPWITPSDLSGYKKIYIGRGARNLTDKGLKESSAKVFPAGSVLFSSRAPVGYVAIASNDLSTNQGFKSFVLPDDLDSKFVYFYLRYIKPVAEMMATGTTFKELSASNAAKLPLILPPLDEQKRIAEKLDQVLARVDSCQTHLERVPQILKRFRQSVLAAATSGQLTEGWREEKGVNGEWERKSLKELVLESANGFSKRRSDNGKETVVLRLADFKNAERFIGNERTVKMDEKELKKYSMADGDLLVIRVNGSRDLAGRFIEYKNPSKAIEAYCDHFIRLRLDITKILSRFVSYVANSGEGRRYIELELVTSAGQNTINQPSVFGLMMNVPLLEEQTEIVRRVEKLFAYAAKLEARYQSASEQVERLMPSLLAKAFRGELVGQDPNDESASALVERIRETRDAQKADPSVKSKKSKRS